LNLRIKKDEIERLLPHGGSMCLLESVETWDDLTISCRTSTHRDQRNPLRFHGRLTAQAGLEYAAQAMGVHVGLLDGGRQADNRIGLVGAVRDVVFASDRLDDLEGDLIVSATRMVEGENSYMYSFTVLHGARTIIEGRASIFVKGA
jgi:predicted hotdog family 3-hydroxylacyl-ACP dehydratase